VELLIVIAVLAVVAAVSMPVGMAMLDRGRQATCMGNLRGIGLALQLHSQDNGGKFPETTHTAMPGKSWITALENELGSNYERSRVCPADPNREQRIRDGGTSYILNSFIFVPKIDPFGNQIGKIFNRPSAIPVPERTMIAFICSDDTGTGPGNDHTHSERWTTWEAVRRDISPDRFGGGADGGTKGRSNYLFADGSVESIRAADFKSRIAKGENPAKPPTL